MFIYYHCYMPETWEAQEKCGLIDENAGIRFMESMEVEEKNKFNILAAKGGDFYNMMKERRLPMYIDRLQGGVYFEDYDYDMELLEDYKKMLGDKFHGLQMHEWMSNLLNDCFRIKDCIGDLEWTPENIEKKVREKYDLEFLFVEARSPEEHAKWGEPKNIKEFIANAKDLFVDRMKKFDNLLIPCDSVALASDFEAKQGVKRLMPEIGAHCPEIKIQLSYARGIARAYGIPFGVYYQPWGGVPFSCCCYQKDGKNEWGEEGGYGPFAATNARGGSSRSMQKRIQLYSYFAGAEFISEEYGMSNTFYDWENFELTPYGKIKYDFLQFIKKYKQSDIGEIYTPIAIVLPKDLPAIYDLLPGYFSEDDEMANLFKDTLSGIKELLSKPQEMVGNAGEREAFINSEIPDSFDIIHEDTPIKDGKYQYFINLTGKKDFEENHKCIKSEKALNVLKEIMPCEVDGKVHWFVNKTADGWLLIMFNHSGIERTAEEGEFVIPGSESEVNIKIKDGKKLISLESNSELKRNEAGYNITISAGDWFLGKIC